MFKIHGIEDQHVVLKYINCNRGDFPWSIPSVSTVVDPGFPIGGAAPKAAYVSYNLSKRKNRDP